MDDDWTVDVDTPTAKSSKMAGTSGLRRAAIRFQMNGTATMRLGTVVSAKMERMISSPSSGLTIFMPSLSILIAVDLSCDAMPAPSQAPHCVLTLLIPIL